MSEYRDLSRLPVNQDYWDGLEARISAGLGPRVRAAAAARRTWWAPSGAGAWASGSLAAAAVIAALSLAPPREPATESKLPGLLRPPRADPALVEFVASPSPPSLGWLVISTAATSR
jgi:hypothetical protein